MSERMNTTEIFEGIRFPGFIHTLESLKAACAFQFQDTDVLLVTFPKSGTTWMQQVLSLIFCEGHLWPIYHLPNWSRMPWIEQVSFSKLFPELRSSWPRLFTSHLSAKLLAPALMKSKAKTGVRVQGSATSGHGSWGSLEPQSTENQDSVRQVVYMARNPKDTLVSFYHFHRLASFLPDPSSFEDFVDEFLEGTGFFGSWFDHVKGWLGLQKDLNLLFVTYEELHQVGTPSTYPTGVVGDWKEHFTPELDKKFNAVYQSKMGDSGLCLPWTMD
ncbi:hypothetical protein U0070_027509 [Myodes glareolus]|uniref:Sulfotransferase n=1 Tax=Myodes glareolus TaxID=447135 RepID=A0AAW0HJX3_MYOGA